MKVNEHVALEHAIKCGCGFALNRIFEYDGLLSDDFEDTICVREILISYMVHEIQNSFYDWFDIDKTEDWDEIASNLGGIIANAIRAKK